MVKVKDRKRRTTFPEDVQYYEAIVDMGFSSMSILEHLRRHGLNRFLAWGHTMERLNVSRGHASALFTDRNDATLWADRILTRGMRWAVRSVSPTEARSWIGTVPSSELDMVMVHERGEQQ